MIHIKILTGPRFAIRNEDLHPKDLANPYSSPPCNKWSSGSMKAPNGRRPAGGGAWGDLAAWLSPGADVPAAWLSPGADVAVGSDRSPLS